MKPLAKDTLSLFKGITFIALAKNYLEFICLNKDVRHDSKHFLRMLINRLNICLREVNMKLSPDAWATLKVHFNSDLLAFDAVFDKMADMTEGQRLEVEAFCDQIKLKKTA